MLAGNLCLGGAFLLVCAVTISLCSALLLYPSFLNAMSSLAHQSMARETAMLHQASHYSLCLLSMPRLANNVSVWSRLEPLCGSTKELS